METAAKAVGAPPAPAVAPAAAPKPAAAGAAQSVPGAPPSPLDTGQRLIQKTASLALLVNDVAEAMTGIRVVAESYQDGFVVNANQREENGRPVATITIRIPADRFDEVLGKLKERAVRVTSEQINSRDITEEYVDVDARLRNLKVTEARYLELLGQARTIEDMIKIEQQLANVRTQIDQLQGRLQYLQRTTATSTITTELRPYAAAERPAGEWGLLPIVANAWAALLNTLQFLLSALIWVGIFAPLWVPLLLLGVYWRRRTRRQAHPAAPATPPASA